MLNFMHKEIEDGKQRLFELGNYVRESFSFCQTAFLNFDEKLAKEVIERDDYVDEKEVKIEEALIRYISLYQPVATDLRLVISMLKINHDLERIHDSLGNVCQTVLALKGKNKQHIPKDFKVLFEFIDSLLLDTLEAFFNVDSDKALEVCQRTKELKQIKNLIFSEIEQRLQNSNKDIEEFLHITFTLKNSYRIGKNTVNIAEDVYYLKKGEIIRHQHPNIERP